MMMPSSAMTPRMATKPNGEPVTRSPAAAPISPSGPVKKTSIALPKCCSWIIRSTMITNSMIGALAAIEAWLSAASSAPPWMAIEYPAGS